MKIAILNQSIYFKIVFTLKFKSKDMLIWGRGYTFVSTGNESLWIHSRLTKIRFDQRRHPENSPVKSDGPGDPAFRRAYRSLTEMIQLHKDSSQDLTILIFSGSPKDSQHPPNSKK